LSETKLKGRGMFTMMGSNKGVKAGVRERGAVQEREWQSFRVYYYFKVLQVSEDSIRQCCPSESESSVEPL
jgi:hypothetical protein